MARFRRSFRSRRSSPRRTREWLGWSTLEAGTANVRTMTLFPNQTSTNWILFPSAALAQYDEPTAVRFLINHWWTPVPTDFATSDMEITIVTGIIAVRGEISGTGGIDGIPNVAVQRGDQDYIWREERHFARFQNGALQPLLSPGGINEAQGPGDIYDIRSKRKLPQGFGLLYFNLCTADSYGGGMVGFTSGRFLVLNN